MTNIIVDGNNLLHRSTSKTNKFLEENNLDRKLTVDGFDSSSIQKFVFDLYYSTQEFHSSDSQIYVVWDRKIAKNSTNWRKELNPLYKAQRDDISISPQKQAVHDLSGHLKKILTAMGIYSVYPLTSEGDDIMYYLRNTLEGDTVLVSADQDFYQCVSDDCIVYNPQKRITLTVDNFEEHVPVSIENYVMYKSIKGDPSDNLKGLYMYGEKKAKKLVENWETDSLKLSEDQLAAVEDSRKIIDLSWKPLTPQEIKTTDQQVGRKLERLGDSGLTQVFDAYMVSYNARVEWDKYFNIKDLGFE